MATETYSETGAPGGAEAPGLPQLDTSTYASQLFWLVLTFVALYMFFARVALPKIGSVIEERRDKIADDLDKASELQKKTEEAISQYEAALAAAKTKAHGIAQEMRDQLNEETARQREELEAELDARLKVADERIRETKETALANVREVAEDVAGSVYEKITGRQADPSRIGTAVAEQLAKKS